MYLRARKALSFEAPLSDESVSESYVSDPANPVPYRQRPFTYRGWAEWQLEDQRLAHGRPDILTYVSDPLESDLKIAGNPIAHLYAATTGTDSDWVVKLIDVYPDPYLPEPQLSGFMHLVCGEIFLARYRNSFYAPQPVTAGEVTHYQIDLRSRNHTFKAGHRIMVQIQSSWFPLFDRNPQVFVDNIYEAPEAAFRPATQTIHHSPQFPSHLALPVNSSRE
jgi:putative CocE/NonD family hydrolase